MPTSLSLSSGQQAASSLRLRPHDVSNSPRGDELLDAADFSVLSVTDLVDFAASKNKGMVVCCLSAEFAVACGTFGIKRR